MTPAQPRINVSAQIGWVFIAILLLVVVPGALHAQSAGGIRLFTTVQDFSATCGGGPALANPSISEDGDGEVALAAALED